MLKSQLFMNEKLSIAIVDDHPIFRTGLADLLKKSKQVDVLFEAGNGLEMQKYLHGPLPQVVLMDIHMPEMDGYKSCNFLKAHYPQIRVLALSMEDDQEAIYEMIKNGARGYLLKESRGSEVLMAIKAVHESGYYINEKVSGRLISLIQNASGTEKSEVKISDKEIEFIKFCCSELTYKEIAAQMFLSPHTIENYRESLFSKLRVRSRVGIVLYAIKNGIFSV
jgi:DNA-binding NarL/FixJ family response regulator